MIDRQLLAHYQEQFKQSLIHIYSVPAVHYLKQRKITWETVEKFKLGYAHNIHGVKELPWFNETVTIPCFDLSGNIVNLFGRSICGRDPKYAILKESKKELSVLGLYQAQQDIVDKGYVILAEGIFDCITLSQSGFRNTVSSPGKSWSDIQLGLLSRFTNNIIINFDNDNVGKESSEKVAKRAKELGFYVSIVFPPEEYKDSDESLDKDFVRSKAYFQERFNVMSNV